MIDDPVLATVLFDAAWVAEQGPWARQIFDLAGRDARDARLVRAGDSTSNGRRSWTIGRVIHAIFFESSAMPRRFQPSPEHRNNGRYGSRQRSRDG